MSKLLVEIQASHAGIGKSTFTENLGYPWVDDCVNLVESVPEFFSSERRDVFQTETDNEKLRSYLVLENTAAQLDALTKHLYRFDKVLVTSRSPLISGKQFAKCPIDWEPLEEYYRKRLEHLNIGHVLILDYGSSIQSDEAFLKKAYERMKKRGREFEQKAYDSFETYKNFFEKAEDNKEEIVALYLKDPKFYTYYAMEFNDFNAKDSTKAKDLIEILKNFEEYFDIPL